MYVIFILRWLKDDCTLYNVQITKGGWKNYYFTQTEKKKIVLSF